MPQAGRPLASRTLPGKPARRSVSRGALLVQPRPPKAREQEPGREAPTTPWEIPGETTEDLSTAQRRHPPLSPTSRRVTQIGTVWSSARAGAPSWENTQILALRGESSIVPCERRAAGYCAVAPSGLPCTEIRDGTMEFTESDGEGGAVLSPSLRKAHVLLYAENSRRLQDYHLFLAPRGMGNSSVALLGASRSGSAPASPPLTCAALSRIICLPS
jgi:hypothetical protein